MRAPCRCRPRVSIDLERGLRTRSSSTQSDTARCVRLQRTDASSSEGSSAPCESAEPRPDDHRVIACRTPFVYATSTSRSFGEGSGERGLQSRALRGPTNADTNGVRHHEVVARSLLRADAEQRRLVVDQRSIIANRRRTRNARRARTSPDRTRLVIDRAPTWARSRCSDSVRVLPSLVRDET